MRNKGHLVKNTVKCIALASAILACIVLITRPLSEYAECW